jgi:hypothetical protein
VAWAEFPSGIIFFANFLSWHYTSIKLG